MAKASREFVYGLNPAFEVLRAGKRKVFAAYANEGMQKNPRIKKLTRLLDSENVELEWTDKGRLMQLSGSREHQGVVLKTSLYPYVEFDELLDAPRLLLLDNLEDPHNVGAILRSAEVFGFTSVCLPKKGVPEIYPSVVKVSTGATEFMKICRSHSANNYASRAAEEGYRIVALDMAGKMNLRDVAIANYEKIVGNRPSENIKEIKTIDLNLPESLAAAYSISNSENPDLQIALFEYKQSKLDVIIAGSDMSPTATLSYKVAEQDDISSSVKNRTQKTVTATATWPLFAGGSNLFNLRKVQELRNQKELLYDDAKKQTETEVANSWSKYQSSKGVLESVRSQVKAAEIASEGISLEYESGGKRTTLEVIQSSSVLLNSRIDLASSERNFIVSQFDLLSAIGRLTAKQLNLKKQ